MAQEDGTPLKSEKMVPPGIVLIGVKKVEDARMPLKALQTELPSFTFPAGWTIKVVCNPVIWDLLQKKTDQPRAFRAISELHQKVTFLNAAIFEGSRSDYRHTIAHELGHIRCKCSDEAIAEQLAFRIDKETSLAAAVSVTAVVPR
jgi:Zn-dependent peptidase ImmA (M78 family)